ncbi:MAG: tRNA 4-thiouridine(8) synthase ThiI [Pseudomonadota bacterium]
MSKAFGIFSGGLDSILSTLVLKKLGVEVTLLTFSTPFFGPEKAIESAATIGMTTRIVDITDKHFEMMKKPRHGFGRNMNPCIDCHALMYREAGQIMEREGGDFLFSGEVLAQRPKSQNRRALDIVAGESGYGDKILRPLSAKALPPTRMEIENLVDRERLLGLTGRTRKPQIELAARFGVANFPAPAGGCLLTDPNYSRRLKELATAAGELIVRDVELLKWGRHFRLPGFGKIVVGRDRLENEAIERLAGPDDLLFKVAEAPGPSVLAPYAGLLSDAARAGDGFQLAAAIAVSYSDAADDRAWRVRVIGSGPELSVSSGGLPKNDFARLMI